MNKLNDVYAVFMSLWYKNDSKVIYIRFLIGVPDIPNKLGRTFPQNWDDMLARLGSLGWRFNNIAHFFLSSLQLVFWSLWPKPNGYHLNTAIRIFNHRKIRLIEPRFFFDIRLSSGSIVLASENDLCSITMVNRKKSSNVYV